MRWLVAALLARLCRPLALLSQPSQGIRSSASHYSRRYPAILDRHWTSIKNDLSIDARKLNEVSPDPGMYGVCRPRHLTGCGSGLSSTEPPGRNCPAQPRSQGMDPSNLGRAGECNPRRGHFESAARSPVGHEHKQSAPRTRNVDLARRWSRVRRSDSHALWSVHLGAHPRLTCKAIQSLAHQHAIFSATAVCK